MLPDDMPNSLASAQWGYARFQRGKVLCVRIDDERVVLIEPSGGYMFLGRREVSPVPPPSLETIIAALCDISPSALARVKAFCLTPKTQKQISDKYDSVQPWVLRKVGVLKDVGRVDRKIVSVWADYDWGMAEAAIAAMKEVPTSEINNPK